MAQKLNAEGGAFFPHSAGAVVTPRAKYPRGVSTASCRRWRRVNGFLDGAIDYVVTDQPRGVIFAGVAGVAGVTAGKVSSP